MMEDGEVVDISAALRMGVYLLWRRGRCVFVGKAKCPMAMIETHRSLARKRVPEWMPIKGVVFDRAEVIPAHPDRIDALWHGLRLLHLGEAPPSAAAPPPSSPVPSFAFKRI